MLRAWRDPERVKHPLVGMAVLLLCYRFLRYAKACSPWRLRSEQAAWHEAATITMYLARGVAPIYRSHTI